MAIQKEAIIFLAIPTLSPGNTTLIKKTKLPGLQSPMRMETDFWTISLVTLNILGKISEIWISQLMTTGNLQCSNPKKTVPKPTEVKMYLYLPLDLGLICLWEFMNKATFPM